MTGLLEREAEQAQLAAACDELRAGRGRALLLEGPPGIGKTALMEDALAALAADGTPVLRAHGSELESALAFGGVRQLFGAAVLRMDEEERDALLLGAASHARPVLGLAAGPSSLDVGVVDPLYALYWLAAGLAERGPLVLAIDDLHWLDAESARFVAYLIPRLEDLPLLLLATARAPEPGVEDVVSAAQGAFSTVIRPPALSPQAVGRLLEQQPRDEVYRLTGGNPLLAVELQRSLALAPAGTPLDQLGSPTLARLVLSRVAKVSAEAVALARAVALFADAAELEDAAAVARLEDADLAAEVADALVAVQVFAAGGPLRFLHPLMRHAVYEELGAFERRRGHERAATRLKARGAPAEAIAAHLLAAPPERDAENVALLQAAADEAIAAVAPRAAVRYLQRALEEGAASGPQLRRVLLDLGRLQRLTGHPDAQATLTRATVECQGTADRAEALLELSVSAWSNQDHAALRSVEAAARTADLGYDDRLALDMVMAESAWEAGDMARCMALIDAVPPDLPGDTAAQRVALVQSASVRFMRLAPLEEVTEQLLRALGDRGADALVASVDIGDPLGWLIQCEALDAAEALAEERLELARETGNEALFAATQNFVGWIALARGEMPAAVSVYRHALTLPGLSSYSRVHCVSNLTEVLIDQGRTEEAAGELSTIEGEVDPDTNLGGWIGVRQGRLALARGDNERALEHFARKLARVDAVNPHPNTALWKIAYLDCLVAVGRREEAVALARELVELTVRTGGAWGAGAHRLALGRLTGDAAELERAHAILEPSPFRWWAARARLELGAMLRQRGELVAAREHLRAALDYSERNGVEHFAARARDELRLAGARPRRALLTGVESLTPGEERIARLAAAGKSNREIAQDLFITVKTVEGTLARAYRKLDVGSRGELTAALA